MPVHVTWMVPEKLILVEHSDFVPPQELSATVDLINRLLDRTAASRVHIVATYNNVTYLPSDLRVLVNIARSLSASPNLGYIVFVATHSRLITTIATLLSQLLGFKYRVVQSTDDALTFLSTVDPEASLAI